MIRVNERVNINSSFKVMPKRMAIIVQSSGFQDLIANAVKSMIQANIYHPRYFYSYL